MKKRIVGIFVMTLLITTTSLVLSENNMYNISDDYEVVMFIQEPDIPENEPDFGASDIDESWMIYEDFYGLTSPIREIHWWNIAGKWVGNKINPSDPEGAVFTITIHEDDGTGKPGDIVCSFENVIPTITGTGIIYEYTTHPQTEGIYELYYYEAVLDSSCVLSNGWVSIVKTDSIHDLIGGLIVTKDGNDNICFYNTDQQQWYFFERDVSFALIGYSPDLICDGSLGWADVKTGETKTGTITVENIGGPDTLLNWRVESNMDWGDWTFSPESGDGLTPDDEPVTITVTVTAPDEKNMEFTGELYLVNTNDEQDKCTIPVNLITSKTKEINTPFLTFLENHPRLFPLIRQILGL